MSEMSLEHFALCLTTALKLPDIQGLLKQITHPSREEFADMISSELHRQQKPYKDELLAKDNEIKTLKETISVLDKQLDNLEQHGRRDSLRIAAIHEKEEHDDTDAAVLKICQAIKVDPPVQPTDIAVSHRVGRPAEGRTRQLIVKFATRNVRERVYSTKKELKNVRKNENMKNVYINEDLTKFRANLARDARALRTSGLINETWTQYGKIIVKDKQNRISVIHDPSELQAFSLWINHFLILPYLIIKTILLCVQYAHHTST